MKTQFVNLLFFVAPLLIQLMASEGPAVSPPTPAARPVAPVESATANSAPANPTPAKLAAAPTTARS